MARIFTDGFEFGSLAEYVIFKSDQQNIVGLTTGARSGTYKLRVYDNHSGLTPCYAYKVIDDISEAYFRVALYPVYTNWNIFLADSSDTALMQVRGSIDGYIQYYIGNTLIATTNGATYSGGWDLVEFHYKMADSGGRIEIKLNGLQIADFTGDTKPNSSTTFNRIYLGTTSTSLGYAQVYYDDVAINDTTGTEDNSWCGDGHIVLYRPNSSGSVTMLMGSDGNQIDNYLLIDDMPSDGDSTYVYSGSPGYYDLYGIQNTSLPVNSVIKRVWVVSNAKDPDLGYINSVIQTASGSYTSGSSQLSTSYQYLHHEGYTTNPSTGSGWTSDEIDNLQIGIQIAE